MRDRMHRTSTATSAPRCSVRPSCCSAPFSEDRSVIDFLDSDFTFVDERLARHYGMHGIRGQRMRRVTIPADSPRRGLLGHGSVLTLTSAANRTSPVVRGKWMLDNLLGTPPPQPPPGVETNLEKDPQQVKATSLRQRLEQHRHNPPARRATA